MATIRVDPVAIDLLAAQLRRYSVHASSVIAYIGTTQEQPATTAVGGQGLLNVFWLGHADLCRDANARARMINTVGYLGSYGVWSAAAYYRATDLAAADAMDATYPPANRRTLAPYPERPAVAMRFEDRTDPPSRLRAPTTADRQPQVAALAGFVGDLADMASISYWVRALILEATGRDIFKDLIEWFTGDWEALARTADGWHNCATAVSHMGVNVSYAAEALGDRWSGNAGEAAGAWTQQLSAATTVEAHYFTYLEQVTTAHVDIAYFAWQQINFLLGLLLDLIGEAIAVVVTTPTGIGPLLVGIVAVVDAIITVCDWVRQMYHAYRVAAAAIGRPGSDDAPESTMQGLRLFDGDTHLPYTYRHPSEGT